MNAIINELEEALGEMQGQAHDMSPETCRLMAAAGAALGALHTYKGLDIKELIKLAAMAGTYPDSWDID
jgi:hypothetical protein